MSHVEIFCCSKCKQPLLGLRSGIALPPGARWIGGINGLDAAPARSGAETHPPNRTPGKGTDPFEGIAAEPVAGEQRVVLCRNCLAAQLGFIPDKRAAELESANEHYQTALWDDKGFV